MSHKIEITNKTSGYELLDSGNRAKLERFGDVILARPDPEAIWEVADPSLWKGAHGTFTRSGTKTDWNIKKEVPASWEIPYEGFIFRIKPTTFKHVGLFPEQGPNWRWTENQIKNNKEKRTNKIRVLNLFAYTGGATLACAKAGAEVTHVDASKGAVTWAKENAELSGLDISTIRFIIEDCMVFLKREAKRGSRYDAIIMDPPAFGHGPKKELWKIEEDLLELFKLSFSLLTDDPLFFLVNGYASGYSPLAYENNLRGLIERFGGTTEVGELAIEESARKFLLPAGIFARWSK